jgi:hypothetical protein
MVVHVMLVMMHFMSSNNFVVSVQCLAHDQLFNFEI